MNPGKKKTMNPEKKIKIIKLIKRNEKKINEKKQKRSKKP